MARGGSSQQHHHHDDTSTPHRNTLNIYWYLLTQPKAKVGVRQAQRAMGFCSPNAALFHLNKLVEMKLAIHRQNGEYQALTRLRFGIMKSFLLIRHHFIPKHAIYATVMTTAMLVCTLILLPAFSLPMVLALLPGLLAMGILWYETVIVWRQRPKFHTIE